MGKLHIQSPSKAETKSVLQPPTTMSSEPEDPSLRRPVQGNNQTQARFKIAPLKFPSFDGSKEKVRPWISKCESYFYLCNVSDEYRKTILASFHFTGRAETWFSGYQIGKEVGRIVWEDLVRDIVEKFQGLGYKHEVVDEFKSLEQVTSVIDNERQFEKVEVQMRDLFPEMCEDFFISCFIAGLKPHLRIGVQMFSPTSFNRCIWLDSRKGGTRCMRSVRRMYLLPPMKISWHRLEGWSGIGIVSCSKLM